MSAHSPRGYSIKRVAGRPPIGYATYPRLEFVRGERLGATVDLASNQPAHLVERIMSGDAAAEAALVERYTRGVRIVLAKSSDPSLIDDIFQETFLLVLVKVRAGLVKEPSKLSAFIVSIANNLLIEHYRKNQRRKTDPDSDMISRVAAESHGPYAHVERDNLIALLQEIILELPTERDRQLLSRFFLEEVEKEELCEELDVSTTHFDRLKYRAINRLKERVHARGGL